MTNPEPAPPIPVVPESDTAPIAHPVEEDPEDFIGDVEPDFWDVA